MIRTSKHTLKFSNSSKLDQLSLLFEDYKEDLEFYINLILTKNLPLKTNLSSKELPSNRIYHSQWKQIIYKNASEIVRSNLSLVKKRIFKKYKKLYSFCKSKNIHTSFTSKKFSELKINYFKRIKINLKTISINIDERLFDFKEVKSKEFNTFIKLRLPYFQESKKRSKSINLPIKLYSYIKKYKDWTQKKTIKLTRENGKFQLSFTYEKSEIPKRNEGKSLGIDIGYNKLIVTSDKEFLGTNLKEIYNRISKKLKGSKNQKGLIVHKNNEIRRICNSLNLNGIRYLFVEDLKNVKHKSKLYRSLNNRLQYWSYREVLNKMEKFSETEGFELMKVEPFYSSQECSNCGSIDKEFRKGELFICGICKFEEDADYNASQVILHRGEELVRVRDNLSTTEREFESLFNE